MLTIKNIEGLRGERLGYWEVVDSMASKPRKWLMTEHYCITLDRKGNGAAILIDRNINPLTRQYHVYICYEDFTNRIHETSLSKRTLMDKGHFLKHMMGYIKYEYEMRKKQ
jgi:hypothetical protein